MRKNFFWPQEHNNVLRIILSKAKKGTRVIYVPGNHDEDLREFCGSVFGNLEIHREFVHTMSDGRQLLVMHGDEFDTVVKCSPWLAKLGCSAYDFSLQPQPLLQRVPPPVRISVLVAGRATSNTRRRMPCSTSRASSMRSRMRRASAASTAWSAGTSIAPEITEIDGVMYCNDGDWVESCSALVEDMNGRLAIWSWPEMRDARQVEGSWSKSPPEKPRFVIALSCWRRTLARRRKEPGSERCIRFLSTPCDSRRIADRDCSTLGSQRS